MRLIFRRARAPKEDMALAHVHGSQIPQPVSKMMPVNYSKWSTSLMEKGKE
jgi:hypothetical protein